MRMQFVAATGVALLCASAFLVAQEPKKEESKPAAPAQGGSQLQTAKEKVSYGIGLNIGRSLKQQKLDVDPAILARGIADMLAGKKPAVSQEELQEAFEMVQAEAEKSAAQAGAKALEAGQKFLVENGKKEGIKTTKSGLQYQVLKAGNGPTPKKADSVLAHYRGRLTSGTVFDESYEGEAPAAGEKPAEFPVGGVIQGWQEALQLMKVGDKWRIFVPSDLGYGARGAGSDIGPNEVLIFDIELIGISQ